MNHLWQRFLLASSLLLGLAIGVIATVFGYSNLAAVDVHWSVFHIDSVPLWTVLVVPIALVLIAGTIYHWMDGLHHFTEHMRHRRRVHELEAEVVSLRAHLDQVLEMPDHSALPAKEVARASLPVPEEPAAEPAPVGDAPPPSVVLLPEPEAAPRKSGGERHKRVKLTVAPDPAPAAPNGDKAGQPATAAEPAPAEPATGA